LPDLSCGGRCHGHGGTAAGDKGIAARKLYERARMTLTGKSAPFFSEVPLRYGCFICGGR